MVRILAGYTIEQDELVRFLKSQDLGPEPGEPELDDDEAWMKFISWRGAQPQRGDPQTLFPWPQCMSHPFYLSHMLMFNHKCRLV